MRLEARMTDTQSSPVTAEELLRDVKTFFNHGEFFRAYDVAADALELFPGNVGLAHRGVLSLANAGATALALEKYYEFGLDQRTETDVRSLLGRLKKDQAFAETGEARTASFREGRALYEDAFRTATDAGDPEAYYPAINAATLALFAGDAEAASRPGGEVLDLLAPRIAGLDEVAADRYWVLATALEAHLVRGDLDAAGELVLGNTQATTVATDIAALLDGMRIGAAYGSLASGADILFAEALLRQGVALNVVLPFAADDFIEQSVRPVSVVPTGPDVHVEKLRRWHRPEVARGRRDTRAMLFGDIHGFSKLSDAQLPIFAEKLMGTLGEVARRYKQHVAFVNTWGDGIFVVFRDAGRAAACALEMQDAMDAIDLTAAGLPETLKLRLGGHLGPVYELDDPVTDRPNYYGAHVSRAARIEPITPEGCVYVTETFAAMLALHNADQFSCDYVGNTEMAKHYGRLRMFLLRRAGDGKGPPVLGDIERAASSNGVLQNSNVG
jgi:class 3 adenylate cyclase